MDGNREDFLFTTLKVAIGYSYLFVNGNVNILHSQIKKNCTVYIDGNVKIFRSKVDIGYSSL